MRERVAALLVDVGLHADDMAKRPHRFSGGQRQRIAIARAIATNPSIVILDEATSALDAETRTTILELLHSLSIERGVSYLMISHDISLVDGFTDNILIMKDGAIIERGPTQAVFDNPQEDYTKALIDAAPSRAHASAP